MRQQLRTYIDCELKERFTARFGGYSAIAYVVETAMKELLDVTEGQPDLEDLIRQSIRTYVLKRKLEASNSTASEPSGINPQ